MWHFRSFPRRLTAILTVLLFISPAFSQDNHRNQKKEIKKITLADSVVLALKNNLDVRSAFEIVSFRELASKLRNTDSNHSLPCFYQVKLNYKCNTTWSGCNPPEWKNKWLGKSENVYIEFRRDGCDLKVIVY